MMVQEYGRYFGMNTVCFRAGCITGPNHQGAELHGFLSYLVKCIVHDEPYSVFGYKGKQVRDNIHAYDLVNAFWQYHRAPIPASVYNVGGGRENSLSIIETIELVSEITGKSWSKQKYVDEARSGDHIWYISDLTKLKTDYPEWSITYPVRRIVHDIICSLSPCSTSVTSILQGGIGNQLYLISLAYATAKRTNRKLLFLKNQFSGCRQGSHPSTYYGSFYQKVPFTDDSSALQITEDNVIRERSLLYYDVQREVDERKGNQNQICFFGYYQSIEYFKEYADEVRDLFTPNGGFEHYLRENVPHIVERYSELFIREKREKYAMIGVRRGDFVTHAHHHNPCGMTYYSNAISRMEGEREIEAYYILTDDMAWCKEKFSKMHPNLHFCYLDIEDGDTYKLMISTLFNNYIISNSTFYWWGSFLSSSKEKLIYAPDKWTNGFPAEYTGCYRDEMTILGRPIETE
tara:strand:- start:586 stop:1968 length:1383 start_codon:yes stop_codon:yes gene_type:complete